MSPELIPIQTNPENLQAFFKRVESPRKIFGQGIVAIENLVILARFMPAHDSSGDWGQWFYYPGSGYGALYVPFGKNGLAAVYLNCGGDIGEDDIARASFVSAYAVWKGNPSGLKEFTFATIAYPGGDWYQSLGDSKETLFRKFFFFQETRQGILKLEQLGSRQLGWFEAAWSGLGPNNLQVKLENTPIAGIINGLKLMTDLTSKKNSGSVKDTLMDASKKPR